MVKKVSTVGPFNECIQTEDNDDNFLEDPALFYDELPQPYRRINKILLEVFNDAWEEIAKWEAARIKDASRIRPPVYDCASQLQGYSDANCLACSPDGLHVVVGLSSGLAVLSGPTQQMEAILSEEGMDIVQLDLKQMSSDVLVINSQDVQGVVRLFAFTKTMLFPLYVFNEGVPEDSMQKTAIKSDMSLSVDFIGIFMQDKSSSQQIGCLEVYRLPRDAWLKEIEATVGRINADKEISAQAEGEMLEEGISSESTGEITETTCRPEGADLPARIPSAGYQRIFASQKFSPPTLTLKLQHPNKIPSMSWSTPYQASRVAGSDGDVIGTGSNHIVSAHHLSNRMAMFKHQHQQHLQYLPKGYSSSSTPAQVLPTFHFLLPGKLSSNDQSSAGHPNTIAVWWSGERHLMQYSLTKSSKDLKPDSVWSMSNPVVSSAVTECNCTMALALSNNSVVIWNRFLGLPYKTLHLDDPGQVSWMTFSASFSTSEVKDLGTEVTGSSGLHLLVQCTTGAVYTVPCTWGQDPAPVLVSTEICNDDEIPSSIELIRGTPQLILIARQDDRIFLHDINEKASLCEVALPKCYILHRALDHPAVVTASGGRMLYAIGTQTATEETSEDRVTSIVRSLFAVKMWLFPHLDSYQPMANRPISQPCCQKVSQNNLEVHTSKILQNRIEEQLSRKTRLQGRWYKMKEELSHTLELMAGN